MAVAAVWYGTLAVSGLVPPTQPGARSVGCPQHLKQIGYALHRYALEHDGYTPPTSDADGFLEALAPRIRNRDCFTCPPEGGGPWSLVPYASRTPGRYALLGRRPKRLFVHGSPGATASTPACAFPAHLAGERVLMADDAPRHKGGRWCLYYDGHVKWLPEGQVAGVAGMPTETKQ